MEPPLTRKRKKKKKKKSPSASLKGPALGGKIARRLWLTLENVFKERYRKDATDDDAYDSCGELEIWREDLESAGQMAEQTVFNPALNQGSATIHWEDRKTWTTETWNTLITSEPEGVFQLMLSIAFGNSQKSDQEMIAFWVEGQLTQLENVWLEYAGHFDWYNEYSLTHSCGLCYKRDDEDAAAKEATPYKKCSRCKQTRYCCTAHQKSHWKEHKKDCQTPQARAKKEKKEKEKFMDQFKNDLDNSHICKMFPDCTGNKTPVERAQSDGILKLSLSEQIILQIYAKRLEDHAETLLRGIFRNPKIKEWMRPSIAVFSERIQQVFDIHPWHGEDEGTEKRQLQMCSQLEDMSALLTSGHTLLMIPLKPLFKNLSHERLFWQLGRLGIPEDLIKVVRKSYDDITLNVYNQSNAIEMSQSDQAIPDSHYDSVAFSKGLKMGCSMTPLLAMITTASLVASFFPGLPLYSPKHFFVFPHALVVPLPTGDATSMMIPVLLAAVEKYCRLLAHTHQPFETDGRDCLMTTMQRPKNLEPATWQKECRTWEKQIYPEKLRHVGYQEFINVLHSEGQQLYPFFGWEPKSEAKLDHWEEDLFGWEPGNQKLDNSWSQ